jgi:tripartite-type tricarboxylate transporter receptor subunit TctC
VLRRRTFLKLSAAAMVASTRRAIAASSPYPARPVYLIVGFSAGGNTDIVARLIGECLTRQMGQPFIVENRSGAATNIATEQVVRASPDGYTLLVSSTSNAINSTLYKNLKFNFVRDTEPIAAIAVAPLVMCVNPSFPARSVPEFIAQAKANPDKLNYASSGIGSPPHVAAELFKTMTGIRMLHVPYRGDTEAISDLVGGRVDVYFATLAGSIQFIRTGSLRALAVTTAERSSALQTVAAMAEFLPGYDATIWNGLNAPKGTPQAIVTELNRQVNAGLADSQVITRFNELGASARPGSPENYAKFVADETEKWGAIVKSTGSQLE